MPRARARAARLVTLASLVAAGEGLRLAFASCNLQMKPQPMWGRIQERGADRLVLLGDTIYADKRPGEVRREASRPADVEWLREQWALQARNENFTALVDAIGGWDNVLAVYDDHDMGANDADMTYPHVREAQAAFCEFFHASGERCERPDGVYGSWDVAGDGGVLRVVLLDVRTSRTPYTRSGEGDFLGEAQWRWLEDELGREGADAVLIGSPISVLPDDRFISEFWGRFPAARARLLTLVSSSPRPVAVISGDIHYAELSEVRCGKRVLRELASSGLTHAWLAGKATGRLLYRFFQGFGYQAAYRPRRHEHHFGHLNFGEVEVDWRAGVMVGRILDSGGAVVMEEVLAPLTAPPGARSTCVPVHGVVGFFSRQRLVLAALILLFFVLPLVTVAWFGFAACMWLWVRGENRRRARIERQNLEFERRKAKRD